MAYNKKKLLLRALTIIKKEKLTTIEAICGYIGINKTTFYTHKLHEHNDIKMAIWKNKEKIKQSLKLKWFNSDNATCQVALYKLLGTKDECHRLNGSKQEIDHTSGGQIIRPQIIFSKPEKKSEGKTHDEEINDI